MALVRPAVYRLVISGYCDPGGQWYGEARLQYYLSFKNEADLARNFVGKGFDVIIDDVVRIGDLYDEWLKHFVGSSLQTDPESA